MKATGEVVGVIVICAVLYLGGTADVAFYTRGEPREGLVVQEMLRTGKWLVPARPAGELTRKPPLYYWLAAPVAARLPEHPELALRLPSAVLATVAVLVVWLTACTLWGRAAGLPAALVLATAFEWTRAATSARVDMTLSAALTCALAGWLHRLGGGRRSWLVVVTLGLALGTLAKGPVALALPALSALGFVIIWHERRVLRRLGALRTLCVAAAIAGAWYALAFAEHGRDFLTVLVRENLLRFIDPEGAATGHEHSFGYLIPLSLVGFLPWTPLLPLAAAPLIQRPRQSPAVFAAVWTAVVIAFFSIAVAKRSVYVLPAFPAIALLVGAGTAAPPERGGLARATRACAQLWPPSLLLLAGIAGALAWGIDPMVLLRRWLKPDDAAGAEAALQAVMKLRPIIAALAIVTASGAVWVARAVRRQAWRQVVITLAALTVLWTVVFDTWLHPVIAQGRTLKGFMNGVEHAVPVQSALYTTYPPDPGLHFYAPRQLRRWRPAATPPGSYVLAWEDQWSRLIDTKNQALTPLLVSEARQDARGRLALFLTPPASVPPAIVAPARPTPRPAPPAKPPAQRARKGSPHR